MWERLTPLVVKAVLLFEPIASPFISLVVKRTLGDWKRNGRLEEYRVQTTRMKKYHYLITVDMEVTPEQTRTALRRARHRLVATLRR